MFIAYRRLQGFSSNETTWLPVNENYKELNLEVQKTAAKSHYKVYKQITELRKTRTIQLGGCQVAALSENVLAFTRHVFTKRSCLENKSGLVTALSVVKC